MLTEIYYLKKEYSCLGKKLFDDQTVPFDQNNLMRSKMVDEPR